MLVGSCDGIQSSLAPAGPEAGRIALLFWALTLFCAAVATAVIILAALAMFGDRARHRWLGGEAVVIGGGIVFPVIALSVLLAYGLLVMRAGAGPQGGQGAAPFRIAVVGERWWWRVIYLNVDGLRVESANELRIPTKRPVAIELTSADVIHSFWVPRLAGKLDMIPGRKNILHLAADEPGISRGQCAEYCGGAHALMSFYVVALDPEDFEAWLAEEGGPAVSGGGSEGERLFRASGCGACHAIRSTPAAGKVGPDLTHVGGRLSLGAGILETTSDGFAAWIGDHRSIKPENRMPPFEFLSEVEVRAIADYLAALE
jgi:cytochrome c oxidase subunit 2